MMISKTRWASGCPSIKTVSKGCWTAPTTTITQGSLTLRDSKLKNIWSWSNMSSSRQSLASISKIAVRICWLWEIFPGWTLVIYHSLIWKLSPKLFKFSLCHKIQYPIDFTFLITTGAEAMKRKSPFKAYLRWNSYLITNYKSLI